MKIRKFETGATRNNDKDKFDYEGFLSPVVLERFGAYMHKHRQQSNGSMRNSDNWQLGITREAYIKSMLRHVMDVWLEHRGAKSREGIEDGLCGVIFNSMGYLYETLKQKNSND
jgi:hypothetical protein